METLLYAAGAVTIIGGALTTIILVGRRLMKLIEEVRQFLEDWRGEPARPGVPARMGVLARLERLDAQVHPNHGTSLRDQVDRTHALLQSHIADPDAHR